MKFLFNFFYYTYFIVSGPILYFIALLIFIFTYPFDKKRIILHKFSIVWALLYLWVCPGWKINYTGKENYCRGQRYIVVANHRAMLDIAILYRIPNVFRYIAKQEVLKMPFVGWLMKLHGDVLIRRGDSSSAKKMLTKCKTWIDKGVDIAIYPEGTRSKDGKVHDFKEGAFLLAKINKTAILPVVIHGTYEAMKGFALPVHQKFELHILPEISAEEVASTSIKDMTKRVHDIIAEKHREIAPLLYS